MAVERAKSGFYHSNKMVRIYFLAIGDQDRASGNYARGIIQTSSINPKHLTVARSMLMPATPLDFLMRK